jgi:hypothetical protein
MSDRRRGANPPTKDSGRTVNVRTPIISDGDVNDAMIGVDPDNVLRLDTAMDKGKSRRVKRMG